MAEGAKERSKIPLKKKFQRKKTFTEALKEKYLGDDEQEECDGFVIQFVSGKQKQGSAELGFLKNVVLNNFNIHRAGIPKGGLVTVCPNVVDLDLANNMIDSWEEAFTLMSELHHLKFVNFSKNKLNDSGDFPVTWAKPLPAIENMVLNGTMVKWDVICQLCRYFSHLRELHLCQNDFEEIKLAEDEIHALEKIECLRLNDNNIKTWDQVWKLHGLPTLKSLILSGNPLQDVFYKQQKPEPIPGQNKEEAKETSEQEYDTVQNCDNEQAGGDTAATTDLNETEDKNYNIDTSEPKDPSVKVTDEVQSMSKDVQQTQSAIPFQHLETLCVSQTLLGEWEHIEALAEFPKLSAVRVKDIPLMSDTSQEEKRKFLVACLPNIKHLNGSEVSWDEREKSERHYVRFFSDKPEKPATYSVLETKHGKLEPLVHIDLNRGFQEWVNLKFIYEGAVVHEGLTHVTQSVQKLKEFLSEIVKLHVRKFKMYHYGCGPFHPGPEPVFDEMNCESLPLSRYDIYEGDEIHIEKAVLSLTRKAAGFHQNYEIYKKKGAESVDHENIYVQALSKNSIYFEGDDSFLLFSKGDIILQTRRPDRDGWCYGKLGDKEGYYHEAVVCRVKENSESK